MGIEALLSVVEAAYSMDSDERTWLADLTDAGRRAFGDTGGALGFRYRIEAETVQARQVAGDTTLQELPDEGHSTLSAGHVLPFYRAAPHATRMSMKYGRIAGAGRPWLPPALERMWGRVGFSDMFGVFCGGGDDGGIALGFGIPRGRAAERMQLRRKGRVWTAVALHVARAESLRTALESGGAIAAELDARGRGDFTAEAWADRHDLAERASWMERLRSSREEVGSVLHGWHEVLSGRWSLVRLGGEAGRPRYVVVENPPEAVWLRASTRQERDVLARVAEGQTNKVIAVELGLHESSVAALLRRAMRKLGVGRRIDVPRLARGPATTTASLPAVLTDAEQEVVTLALAGCSGAEIAARRGRSYRTIANQLAAVYDKLGVASRTELAAKLGGRAWQPRVSTKGYAPEKT